MYGEVGGGVGRGKRSKSPKIQGFQGPWVSGSQGPRYLKLTFKYELDSKEGPSCFIFISALNSLIKANMSHTPM